MATLLAIVQNAVREIGGIAVPSAVVTSTDRTILRLLALANREGRDLTRINDWTALQRLHTFSTVASQEEYSLPSDFDRLMPDTEWDRSNYRPMVGALTAQEWEIIKSGLVGSGIVGKRYRIVRSASSTSRTIRIDPTPSAAETLAFWYVSRNWCQDSEGNGQEAWAADDDTFLLEDDLMQLGIIIRWKRAVGLEFASEAREHADMLATLMSNERPARTLSMAPSTGNTRLLDVDNIPETGFGA